MVLVWGGRIGAGATIVLLRSRIMEVYRTFSRRCGTGFW